MPLSAGYHSAFMVNDPKSDEKKTYTTKQKHTHKNKSEEEEEQQNKQIVQRSNSKQSCSTFTYIWHYRWVMLNEKKQTYCIFRLAFKLFYLKKHSITHT